MRDLSCKAGLYPISVAVSSDPGLGRDQSQLNLCGEPDRDLLLLLSNVLSILQYGCETWKTTLSIVASLYRSLRCKLHSASEQQIHV